MTEKVVVIPGPDSSSNKEVVEEKHTENSLEKGASTSDVEENQALSQALPQDIPPDVDLVWRCTCGKEMDRFCPAMTKHIRNTRESGEKHRWSLVDRASGVIYANSIAQARLKHLTATPQPDPPPPSPKDPSQRAGGKDPGKTTEKADDLSKYKPGSPLVAKWVAATDELPAELLLLYKLFVDRCIAMNRLPPTRGEWITQTISQFYMEHAEDFDIKGMAENFIKSVCGG